MKCLVKIINGVTKIDGLSMLLLIIKQKGEEHNG